MDDFSVPDIQGFTVGRELGRGGSSSVWLVTEERTGREFALKCLLTEAPRDGHSKVVCSQDAVRREIRILSVLDHQHLIKAHDVVRLARGILRPGASERPVAPAAGLGLLMDYAPGGSLGQLVSSRGKISVGETVTVLTPVAQALGYLHGRGFTHSDVSPGNVLFTGHGKPMLADLGIARMVGDASAVADHGTDGFMDPTPVDAVRAGLQPERDVYSVAALGWYCLTGEPPRRTADRAPLSLLRPEVPAELAAALESGLNEDRRLRPTASELATAVYRSAAPLPVDLAGSVHSTVIHELLTRRRIPDGSGGAAGKTLRSWHRRLSTSRWSGVVRARQVLPFPAGDQQTAKPPDRVRRDIPPVRGKHSKPGAAHGRQDLPARPTLRGAHARPRGGRTRAILQLAGAAMAVVAGAIGAAAAFGPAGPWASPPAVHSPPPVSPQAARAEPRVPEQPDAGGAVPAGPHSTGTARAAVDPDIPEDITARLMSTDPGEAVQGLAWIRSHALSSGRLELLDQVNAPGSAAFASDELVKARLRDSGRVLAGFTSTISSTRIQPGNSSSRAVVTVTSATSSYQETDQSGAIVAARPAGEAQELRLVLVSVDGRWRLAEILPVP